MRPETTVKGPRLSATTWEAFPLMSAAAAYGPRSGSKPVGRVSCAGSGLRRGRSSGWPGRCTDRQVCPLGALAGRVRSSPRGGSVEGEGPALDRCGYVTVGVWGGCGLAACGGGRFPVLAVWEGCWRKSLCALTCGFVDWWKKCPHGAHSHARTLCVRSHSRRMAGVAPGRHEGVRGPEVAALQSHRVTGSVCWGDRGESPAADPDQPGQP